MKIPVYLQVGLRLTENFPETSIPLYASRSEYGADRAVKISAAQAAWGVVAEHYDQSMSGLEGAHNLGFGASGL